MAAMPLLECFIRGDVDPEVSMLAAQGALAPRADEQLAILVYLVTNDETHVATVANQTIASLPVEAVAGLLARPDTSEKVLAFFAARGIVPGKVATEDTDAPLVDTGEEVAVEAEPEKVNTMLQAMTVPQRLKLAMKGSREQRAVLVRDNNRMIAAAVLSSPKLSESEVEAFARMANVSEDVLRTIGMTRAWTQNYCVCSALIRNAKTPLAISMSLLPRMNDRDVKILVTDRNVPEGLRIAARKMMQNAEARKQ